jgi:TRAP-type mannitol/chloroaromatic compound transport system permease small subunit
MEKGGENLEGKCVSVSARVRHPARRIPGAEDGWMGQDSLEWVDRLNKRVGRVTSYLILGIIAITIWEVFWRYGFNRPTIWVHETSEHLFAIFFLLGGAYTLSQGGHVRVDVFTTKFSERKRIFLELYTSVFFFLFTSLLLWQGIDMAWESVAMLERSQSPWGPYIFHVNLMVPIAAFLMLIQGAAFFIRDLRKLKEGRAK